MEKGTRRERSRAKKARRRRLLVWVIATLPVVLAAALLLAWGLAPRSTSDTAGGTETASTHPVSTPTAAVPPTLASRPDSTTKPLETPETPGTTVPRPSPTAVTSPTTSLSTTTSTTAPSAAPLVKHGPSDHKWIALTFDDNYQLDTAYATLAVLRQYEVPATMFVIGHYTDLGPDLARQIAAGAFEVGDHTRSHCDCTSLSKNGLRIEIGNGTDHYRALTGASTVPLFRPPGGFIDLKAREVAAEKGFKYVVMWDVDTNDWRGRTAAEITETVMSNAHNGAIVLMHLAAQHTAEALPEIITRLRDAGYELVTLMQMLGL